MTETVAAQADVEEAMRTYRRELTGYCYRMLGSSFDAEDAVQETLVRAWKSYATFEGRSSMRSWLYRIATNVCLTALEGRNKRARPMDFGGPGQPDVANLGDPRGEATWLQPMPDAMVVPEDGDPAELAVARESIRLAFVAALQHLPAKQRAVLILREVLQWSAAEAAELLETSVAGVNSALQRARATMADLDTGRGDVLGEQDQALLDRYADAFQRYDIEAMVALLHEDAVLSMPPYPLWLQGPEDIRTWWLGPGLDCKGSRLIPVRVNGMPGFAQYRRSERGGHDAWAVQILEFADGKLVGFNSFLEVASWFPMFGVPLRLEEGEPDPVPVTAG
jgi:RNA polymerase sigma-70 factor, ECF subfamily